MSLSPSEIERIFREKGFKLSGDQVAKFALYLEEILRWNRVHNLVGDREPGRIVERHFLDSLTLVRCFEDVGVDWKGRTVADVGSGAGFPGVPLKIYLKDIKITLIEASSKRCSFLEYLKTKIGEDYSVLCVRAEKVAERFDIVVARALGEFEEIAPLLEGLSRDYVFVMKGSKIKDTWTDRTGYRPYLVKETGSFILWKRITPPSR
ncbi:MAG: 16S rRNA (guanine(527)-N(7))-methyltransferase RsmG [Aquificota bacterium]|nr:16S rRNA (guanine(527)-N(7))-methyltransferase RsmG [Aquificota bacterium]MDQ7081865.1 16S rRNA (guanine(527)-N(7))-methyltransferase RsmG [Aquificota bacterium]